MWRRPFIGKAPQNHLKFGNRWPKSLGTRGIVCPAHPFFRGFDMLSISSSPAVGWPSAPGPAIAPVSAATPVAPVQASARDGQTGSGAFGRDTASARPGEAETAKAAPLLPRPQSDQGQRQGAESPAAQEADKAEAEREQQALQAQEQASKQRLQDVIANVWKASAAVVDMALGREAANASLAGAAPGAAAVGAAPPLPALASVAAPVAPLVLAPVAATPGAEADLEALKAQQDVLAYDAQGHSSLAPLEAGTLVSRRV